MPRTTTITVRLSGALSDFVAANLGDDGSYEDISEYIHDLIRRDKVRAERASFERLKAELTLAFTAPDDTYHPLSAPDVIARNKARSDA
ncbi:MAG: addiction module antitoxin [Deltaproteobacteria bacterium]|nr:addiction module antitoxin [Deltaproteobacteria bacterium]